MLNVTKSQSHKVTKSRRRVRRASCLVRQGECACAAGQVVLCPTASGKPSCRQIGGTPDGSNRLPLRKCLALYSGRHRFEICKASERGMQGIGVKYEGAARCARHQSEACKVISSPPKLGGEPIGGVVCARLCRLLPKGRKNKRQ